MICHLPLLAVCALVGCAPMSIAATPNPLEQSPRAPVSRSVAFNRCIDKSAPPSWKHPPHKFCTVQWSKLGSRGHAVLYRARYQWPSDEGIDYSPPPPDPPHYLAVTEVLFEGTDKGTVVTPLFALQEDETYSFLRPLTFHKVGGRSLVEILICLNGTGGCGQDFLSWRSDNLHALKNETRAQIDKWLAPGYSTLKAPQIDIDSLSGQSGGWLKTDPNCCPSRTVEFSIALLPNEIRVKHPHFVTD